MSDYNDDSNDDLPYEGEDVQASEPTNEQYVEARFPEGQIADVEYAEGEYEEEYTEPENSYYTNEYQQKDYYEPTEETQSYEEVEPVIFVNQSDENYTEDANIYSTELPNYQTSIAPQNAETTEYAEPAEYVESNEYTTTESYDDEGYVAADEYLEPNIYTESDQVEQPQAASMQNEYATETYAEVDYDGHAPVEAGLDNQQYTEQQYVEPQYSEPQYSEQAYAPQQAAYEPAQQGYEGQYDQDHYQPEEQNYDNIGYDESGQLQALGEAAPIDANPAAAQQDFRQEYIAEASNRSAFPTGWAIAGLVLIALMGGGFYYLYSNFVSPDVSGDVPVILADRSEIKTFPSADSETSPNGTKNTDRIQSGSANVGQGATITEPALQDSREEVIDEPTKSEDRVEIADGVVADNDDKDIQNVLTLIKSSANNVEILLKPDDVSQLDQNQISIEGLETILVDAKPVKLNDLIAAANQQTQNTLERVAVANIDDLPVISESGNDPFKDIIAENDATATQLPETSVQPLPETDLSNAIAIASNQAVEPVNIVVEAPKPASRPTVPASVPNTLSPVVAASGGAYGVQLASLPNEASARQAYSQFAAKFPNILAGYSPIIREAIIPDKGTFYRVFAGPLVSYNDANQLCANLRSAGISGCFARKM